MCIRMRMHVSVVCTCVCTHNHAQFILYIFQESMALDPGGGTSFGQKVIS